MSIRPLQITASSWCLLLLWLNVFWHNSAGADEVLAEPHCVVLLHGLGRSSVSMKAVQWRLEREGFKVVNKSYPWMNISIDKAAPVAIEQGLDGCRQLGSTTIHFVTHSMGGIVLRQYLEHDSIEGLGRVVMLAPPNQGSATADHLLGNEFLGPLLPESAQQLGTGEDSVPRKLGPVQFELGVIAGSNSRALSSSSLDDVPNDGTVAVAEARVVGMQDFIVMDVDHTFLMWRSDVLDQVVLFLREGHFNHDSDPSFP